MLLSPRSRFWIVTAAALLGVAAALALGRWQMDRAGQKQALQMAVEEQNKLPAGDNAYLLAIEKVATTLHRRASLRGQWMAEHTVYLENRQMGGQPGFYVLTPLKLQGSDAAIVVQRGWVARNFQNRSQLPLVPTPAGDVTVQGRISPPPAKLYEFAGAGMGAIRQNLDLSLFAAEIRQPLLPLSLVQTAPTDAADAQALQRDWPAPNAGVDKHHGYAAQWFALAALIAILYVWFQFISPRRAQSRHG
jgi:surfeit locus 1 family protein